MRHAPRKRFGQHFLVDAGVTARILEAMNPQAADMVVEIGPGLGALTEPLLQHLSRLHVIEIDRDLAARLRERHPAGRLVVHQEDALSFDFSVFERGLRVVGNLPYNISTPLLFHLAAASDRLRDLHVMLQREVAERMVAGPSSAQYGRLSVALQYRFRIERLFGVGPEAFRPRPKVHSAVVRMVPLPREARLARSEAVFDKVLTSAFSHRRKTLRNALKEIADASVLIAAGVDPGLRAEDLGVEAFVALANRVFAAAGECSGIE